MNDLIFCSEWLNGELDNVRSVESVCNLRLQLTSINWIDHCSDGSDSPGNKHLSIEVAEGWNFAGKLI